MSTGKVKACRPNKWVTDVTYVSRDETSTRCYTRILSDTRAKFFPEDYELSLSAVTPAWLHEVCNDEKSAEGHCPRPPRRKRLQEDEVRKIFSLRKHKVNNTAKKLATIYGVTAKAIREIWTGRSWQHLAKS